MQPYKLAGLISMLLLAAANACATPFSMAHHHQRQQAAHHAPSPAEPPSTQAYRQAMERMHHAMDVEYINDPDMDFAISMIPHHQAAVDMAYAELQYGKDPWVRFLASWIIVAQVTEIGQMKTWLYGRLPAPSYPHRDTSDLYKTAMDRMHCDMMIDYSGDADVDFVRAMIPHHQGAVDMAVVETRNGKNLEMHALAGRVFNSQTQEIALMRNWLAKHGK